MLLSLSLLIPRFKAPFPTTIPSLFYRTFPTNFLLSPINHLVISFLFSYDYLLIPLFFSFNLAPHLPSPHRHSLSFLSHLSYQFSAFTHQSPCLFVPFFLRLSSNSALLFVLSHLSIHLRAPSSLAFILTFLTN